MISIIANANLFLTTLFLMTAASFFVYEAWKKRETPANTIGNFVSAYFLISSIILIWG